jgi:hypothetical protein
MIEDLLAVRLELLIQAVDLTRLFRRDIVPSHGSELIGSRLKIMALLDWPWTRMGRRLGFFGPCEGEGEQRTQRDAPEPNGVPRQHRFPPCRSTWLRSLRVASADFPAFDARGPWRAVFGGGSSENTAAQTGVHWVSRNSLGQVLVGISQSSPRMPRPGTNT